MFWLSLYLIGMLWSFSIIKSVRESGIKTPIWIEVSSVVAFPILGFGMLLGKGIFLTHKVLKR